MDSFMLSTSLKCRYLFLRNTYQAQRDIAGRNLSQSTSQQPMHFQMRCTQKSYFGSFPSPMHSNQGGSLHINLRLWRPRNQAKLSWNATTKKSEIGDSRAFWLNQCHMTRILLFTILYCSPIDLFFLPEAMVVPQRSARRFRRSHLRS